MNEDLWQALRAWVLRELATRAPDISPEEFWDASQAVGDAPAPYQRNLFVRVDWEIERAIEIVRQRRDTRRAETEELERMWVATP